MKYIKKAVMVVFVLSAAPLLYLGWRFEVDPTFPAIKVGLMFDAVMIVAGMVVYCLNNLTR